MLTRISDKTSLLDLSFADLKSVAWDRLDYSDEQIVKEIGNPVILNRLLHTAPAVLAEWNSHSYILTHLTEEGLERIITANLKVGNTRFELSTSMFHDRKQYSKDFIVRNKKHIDYNYIEHQQWITPDFLYEHRNEMDVENFFDSFASNKGIAAYEEFNTFMDGHWSSKLDQSDLLCYATIEECKQLGITPPASLYAVITEQRVMSGDPCGDGQRSYAIWLRKYRRVFNDPEGYPTWDHLLQLFKKHPRMNSSGYVDWLRHRVVNHSEEVVRAADEHLSYSPRNINVHAYQEVTGESNNEAEANFNTEFMDVVNPEEFKRVVEEFQTANPELVVARERATQEHKEALERERIERNAKLPPRDANGRFMARTVNVVVADGDDPEFG